MLSGYRTVIFNVVMVLIAIVKAFNPDAVVPDTEAISHGVDQFLLGFGLLWAIGGITLRAVTSSPIFKKKPEVQPVEEQK